MAVLGRGRPNRPIIVRTPAAPVAPRAPVICARQPDTRYRPSHPPIVVRPNPANWATVANPQPIVHTTRPGAFRRSRSAVVRAPAPAAAPPTPDIPGCIALTAADTTLVTLTAADTTLVAFTVVDTALVALTVEDCP